MAMEHISKNCHGTGYTDYLTRLEYFRRRFLLLNEVHETTSFKFDHMCGQPSSNQSAEISPHQIEGRRKFNELPATYTSTQHPALLCTRPLCHRGKEKGGPFARIYATLQEHFSKLEKAA